MLKKTAVCSFLLGALIVAPASADTATTPGYRPGLGQMMLWIGPRHEKLWHAAAAKNWELAAFYTDELEGSFRQLAKWFPTHEDLPEPTAKMIESLITPAFAEVKSAITAKDMAQFTKAYDRLTDSCNACHAASNHAMIKMQRPGANSFTNQDFKP